MVDVKICGVCSAADARLAAAAGATYIGVILAPARSRSCSLADAGAIFEATSLRRVGVFVDATPDDVAAAASRLRLDAVQLHGGEPRGYVEAVSAATGAQVWKAVRVREAADIARASQEYGGAAQALLLDGWSPHAEGGVGAAFDWSAAAAARAGIDPSLKLIAAGGLNAGNVARAIALLRPDVVDVSSGVEEAVCRKSADRVHAFVAAAHGALLKDTQ